ncbi:MAG: hypothetical protein Kow0069_29940 [Promethearchaeota archaeon]
MVAGRDADDVVLELLGRCEADKVPAFYERVLGERGGIVDVRTLRSIHPRFKPETVFADAEAIPGLLVANPSERLAALLSRSGRGLGRRPHSSPRPRSRETSLAGGPQPDPPRLLLNAEGLAHCLKLVLSRLSSREAPVERVAAELGLRATDRESFLRLLQKTPGSKGDRGFWRLRLETARDTPKRVGLIPLWQFPGKKAQLLQILAGIAFGALLTFWLLRVASNVVA